MDFSISFSWIGSIFSLISSDSDIVLIVFFILFVYSSNCGGDGSSYRNASRDESGKARENRPHSCYNVK